ncbi:periplasmic heavy metal sensor [Pacificispira sp.]|uniref:periplasmic heavy metal sensor n=1 Tax=Pacificispira sp. TaxID=2888761 RepID=UPI003B51553A
MSTGRKSSLVRWLLIGSLALNLFLIGFFGVGALRHHWHDGPPHKPFKEMIHFMRDRGPEDRFLHHLSAADADIMRALKQRHGAALKDSWQESREARNALRDLMRAGERDPAILRAAMDRARETRQASFLTFEALMLDVAAQLSDEGYRALAGDARDER